VATAASGRPAETVKPVDGAPAVTPSAEAVTAPAEIELTIDATPPVDVYLGAVKIGTSAAPIKLKRGDVKVKLTFKAVGYVAQDVEVPAAANTVVAVKLVKAAGAKKKSDLEY